MAERRSIPAVPGDGKGMTLNVAGIPIPLRRTFGAIDRLLAVPIEALGDKIESKLWGNLEHHVESVQKTRRRKGKSEKVVDPSVRKTKAIAEWALRASDLRVFLDKFCGAKRRTAYSAASSTRLRNAGLIEAFVSFRNAVFIGSLSGIMMYFGPKLLFLITGFDILPPINTQVLDELQLSIVAIIVLILLVLTQFEKLTRAGDQLAQLYWEYREDK